MTMPADDAERLVVPEKPETDFALVHGHIDLTARLISLAGDSIDWVGLLAGLDPLYVESLAVGLYVASKITRADNAQVIAYLRSLDDDQRATLKEARRAIAGMRSTIEFGSYEELSQQPDVMLVLAERAVNGGNSQLADQSDA